MAMDAKSMSDSSNYAFTSVGAKHIRFWTMHRRQLSSTWTVEGRWGGPHDCPLGEGAPLTWGRPGGNGELLGAPHLSWLHVISDCVAVTVLVAFLCRSQRLMLRRDPLMEV